MECILPCNPRHSQLCKQCVPYYCLKCFQHMDEHLCCRRNPRTPSIITPRDVTISFVYLPCLKSNYLGWNSLWFSTKCLILSLKTRILQIVEVMGSFYFENRDNYCCFISAFLDPSLSQWKKGWWWPARDINWGNYWHASSLWHTISNWARWSRCIWKLKRATPSNIQRRHCINWYHSKSGWYHV